MSDLKNSQDFVDKFSDMEGLMPKAVWPRIGELSRRLFKRIEALESQLAEAKQSALLVEFEYCDGWPCDAAMGCACYEQSLKDE